MAKSLICKGLRELNQENVADELLPLLVSESSYEHEMNLPDKEMQGIEFGYSQVSSYSQLLEMELV